MNDKKELEELIVDIHYHLLCGHEGKSNALLSQLYDSLISNSQYLSEEKMKVLSQYLTIMYDAQKRRDIIYLADILMYEVKTLLCSVE